MAKRPAWRDLHDAFILWDDLDEPHSNTRHVLDAGYEQSDVEHVLRSPNSLVVLNDGDAEFAARGETPGGEFVHVPFDVECEDPLILYPRTIYPPERLS